MHDTAPSARPSQRARDDAELFERWRSSGDPAQRDALVERFLPLARHLAWRYHRGERDDVMQVAALGLLKAIDRYDPARGTAFSTFAVPTILGEIRRYFRDLGWMVRVPRDVHDLALLLERRTAALEGELGRQPTLAELAQRCETSVERVLEARMSATAHHALSLDQSASGEDQDEILARLASDELGFAQIEQEIEVDQLLSVLPEREQLIVRLRFQADLKQREIAERVGISQMQVSRILAKALATLRSSSQPLEMTRRCS